MKCFGCKREIEIGDRYIEDTASIFIGQEPKPEIDRIISEIFDGGDSGKIFFCEDCTVEGGDYMFETYWGDEDE